MGIVTLQFNNENMWCFNQIVFVSYHLCLQPTIEQQAVLQMYSIATNEGCDFLNIFEANKVFMHEQLNSSKFETGSFS